jgi:hypothetical protein
MANLEQWGSPGFRGYEVSDHGQVRSVDRIVAAKYTLAGRRSSRLIKGQILTPVYRKDGTPCFNLWRGNRCYQVPLRRLMLLAFGPPRPPGTDAINVNGDVADNALSNLRWERKHKKVLVMR